MLSTQSVCVPDPACCLLVMMMTCACRFAAYLSRQFSKRLEPRVARLPKLLQNRGLRSLPPSDWLMLIVVSVALAAAGIALGILYGAVPLCVVTLANTYLAWHGKVTFVTWPCRTEALGLPVVCNSTLGACMCSLCLHAYTSIVRFLQRADCVPSDACSGPPSC